MSKAAAVCVIDIIITKYCYTQSKACLPVRIMVCTYVIRRLGVTFKLESLRSAVVFRVTSDMVESLITCIDGPG